MIPDDMGTVSFSLMFSRISVAYLTSWEKQQPTPTGLLPGIRSRNRVQIHGILAVWWGTGDEVRPSNRPCFETAERWPHPLKAGTKSPMLLKTLALYSFMTEHEKHGCGREQHFCSAGSAVWVTIGHLVAFPVLPCSVWCAARLLPTADAQHWRAKGWLPICWSPINRICSWSAQRFQLWNTMKPRVMHSTERRQYSTTSLHSHGF